MLEGVHILRIRERILPYTRQGTEEEIDLTL